MNVAFDKISFWEANKLVRGIIQVCCLFIGMYGLFNGTKSWRWISASTVVLATVNMMSQ